ncbi:hypothetical protein BHE74_00022261 [Ensete ventricosum]|nr:hypothetical protein BHE74_00022261 [Ensete ventricosum]
MSDHHTYKKVELVGSSTSSIEDAINNALAEAHKSIKHLEWFEVVDTRGHIKDGKAAHFQVTLKVGFRIATLAAGKPCEELKSEIAAKIDAKGATHYSLEVVDKGAAAEGYKVVGSCEAGTKEIAYKRG